MECDVCLCVYQLRLYFDTDFCHVNLYVYNHIVIKAAIMHLDKNNTHTQEPEAIVYSGVLAATRNKHQVAKKKKKYEAQSMRKIFCDCINVVRFLSLLGLCPLYILSLCFYFAHL